jgi:TPR repeat protein
MYQSGQGLSRNMAQAAYWLEKSAQQGNVPAQVMLSTLYATGEGVAYNVSEAYMWLNLASAYDADARYSRGQVEKVVSAEQIAEGQKLTRQWMSQHPHVL